MSILLAQARGYGTHAPIGQPERQVPAVWWCHKYRRPPRDAAVASAAASAGDKEREAAGAPVGSWWSRLSVAWSLGAAAPRQPIATDREL
jgi:hypothetical protein